MTSALCRLTCTEEKVLSIDVSPICVNFFCDLSIIRVTNKIVLDSVMSVLHHVVQSHHLIQIILFPNYAVFS